MHLKSFFKGRTLCVIIPWSWLIAFQNLGKKIFKKVSHVALRRMLCTLINTTGQCRSIGEASGKWALEGRGPSHLWTRDLGPKVLRGRWCVHSTWSWNLNDRHWVCQCLWMVSRKVTFGFFLLNFSWLQARHTKVCSREIRCFFVVVVIVFMCACKLIEIPFIPSTGRKF